MKCTLETVKDFKLSNAFHVCTIGNHSVTKCNLLSLSNIHVHQSDTQLLRQSFSHYKSCKLLHQSNIMSVRYTATEAVSQSVTICKLLSQ